MADCQYQGFEFGAPYPDSMCVDGRLYDADNCDDQGNLYEPSEEIPCPMCDPSGATRWHADNFRCGGANPKAARRSAKRLVKDIRSHRKPNGAFVEWYLKEVVRG